MELLFSKKHWVRFAYLLGGIIVIFFLLKLFVFTEEVIEETAAVARGTVLQTVTVSGSIRTPNTATLGFAAPGVIENILVKEGDTVEKGEVLATLSQSGPLSDYNTALAAMRSAEATREELVRGPREESRNITTLSVEMANNTLSRTIEEQAQRVENARRTLYSEGLAARALTVTNNDTPPTISGTYLCEEPRTYRFEIYASDASSGYSYRIIEGEPQSPQPAVTESAIPFGTCGLLIRFDGATTYNRGTWEVEVPNTRSGDYTLNKNTYELVLKTEAQAIAEAKEALEEALRTARLDTAPARSEALKRAEADVFKATAALLGAEAKIADYTIRAPFSGIITSVDIARGEIGGNTKGIAITAQDTFELKIRIPEIDITKIEIGDSAQASFDARAEEIIETTVSFISPLPTLIDGVAYYEAFLTLDTVPSWIRTGLNADVDVVVGASKDTLVLPRRFVKIEEDAASVLIRTDEGLQEHKVTLGLIGTDGLVEMRDIAEGTTVVAP